MAKAWNLKGAKDKLEEILTFDINKLVDKPWLKPRVEAILKMAREYLQRIQEAMKELQLENENETQ